NAGSIRKFLRGRIQKGWRQFVIDLKGCPGIDSTFIGMLYCLASDLSEMDPAGSLEVINLGERNERSIQNLGMDCLIRLDSNGEKWKREQELVDENLVHPHSCAPLEKQEKTELVLEAHEALMSANEQNRNQFCDVVEFLRKDLEAQTADN
ncbi:MAG: STAS domain-containing protein, partial [Verrucomicrobiota bacterium]